LKNKYYATQGRYSENSLLNITSKTIFSFGFSGEFYLTNYVTGKQVGYRNGHDKLVKGLLISELN